MIYQNNKIQNYNENKKSLKKNMMWIVVSVIVMIVIKVIKVVNNNYNYIRFIKYKT